MQRRQPLPRLWLMTDERLGECLFDAIGRLPRGAGIVFRHYGLPETRRRVLFEAVRVAARRKHLLLLVAGPDRLARRWRADGSHGRGRGRGLRTAPAHDLREIRAAERAGAALIFLSPVHATRSHPEARPLGRYRFAALARLAGRPVVALGGVDARRGQSLVRMGAYGWAAIDAWLPASDQKRKAVPI